jgi:hypothetical protein
MVVQLGCPSRHILAGQSCFFELCPTENPVFRSFFLENVMHFGVSYFFRVEIETCPADWPKTFNEAYKATQLDTNSSDSSSLQFFSSNFTYFSNLKIPQSPH